MRAGRRSVGLGSRGRGAALAVAGALSSTLSCAPEPSTRWLGHYLHFVTDLDVPICEGTFHRQERLVELLAAEFGAVIDTPVWFELTTPDDAHERCESESAFGCYRHRREKIYSSLPYHPHEIVHAVAAAAAWTGPTAFTEGLAEAYSHGARSGTDRLPVAEVLADFQLTRDHYYTMALFVRFLLERHGVAAFGAFMRATEFEDDVDMFAPSFAAVFAEPLEAAIAAFEAYPTCQAWQNHVALMECADEATPWAENSWAVEVDLRCASAEVVGPLNDKGGPVMAANRTLVVDADALALATVSYSGAGRGAVRLTRCGSCWDTHDLTLMAGDELRVLSLPAGRYRATFLADLDVDGDGEVDAEAGGGLRVELSRF